ncbi:MAG: hypothetical protein KatS3mg027_0518 [Bacteroidia bacterium]|nr:MAG: hypothetical protein KatS3mg027_0518 [Bacteroidia bacterium]
MKRFLFSFLIVGISEVLFSQSTLSPAEDGFTITEIIVKDSVSAKELLNRATVWAQKKHPKYDKVNAVGGTTKVELEAEFKIKPKELNPPYDFTGKIVMHVKIEVKDGKYRYTINKVKHIADNGKNSGGDITKEIAECGSMFLPEMTWKKIKAEAIKDANVLAEDIKDAMSTPYKAVSDEW